MNRTRKLIALVFALVSVLAMSSFPASAVFDQPSLDLGFSLDSSVFRIDWYSSGTNINVYRSGGKYLGSAYQKVGLAAQKTNTKRKTVLIRLQLDPADTKYGNLYFHGINKTGSMTMTLKSGQSYVNYAPDSTIVTYQDTLSFSLGGTVSAQGQFGGSLGIGASTTTTNNGFTVVSKITNSQKTYTTTYNYSPTWNIASTSTRRNLNKWLNGSHKEYAMYQFDMPSPSSFTINYTVGMWFATSTDAVWSGSTYDVMPSQSTATQQINYS